MNHYSVASSGTSSLLTDLHKHMDQSESPQRKQGVGEVLSVGDRAIAGLAQATPEVKPLLQQLFQMLAAVSGAANQGN